MGEFTTVKRRVRVYEDRLDNGSECGAFRVVSVDGVDYRIDCGRWTRWGRHFGRHRDITGTEWRMSRTGGRR
ncbi:hypothetical protein [Nocardia terpenica]|uniref:Uncharacterized protein n=1 Tax=Nocardia terpenica TaxID=455432 RepID=A0A164H0E4_9NOCA|nr:hypothetical protein [Nocardia terpenica]KZM68098.1 hypothetical protein AWN90_09150 [Nocardia terpenica]NQE89047.1 hypothetical protein [Nocardia terpenica]